MNLRNAAQPPPPPPTQKEKPLRSAADREALKAELEVLPAHVLRLQYHHHHSDDCYSYYYRYHHYCY